MNHQDAESMEQLFRAILQLHTPEECEQFFTDLCTIKELQDMAQRLATAKMLDEGAKYKTISDSVHISTATISRVSRCLNYGTGGYRAALDALKAPEDAQ